MHNFNTSAVVGRHITGIMTVILMPTIHHAFYGFKMFASKISESDSSLFATEIESETLHESFELSFTFVD